MKMYEHNVIFMGEREESVSKMEWNDHPSFKGVSMKHIIKGAATEGMFSSHIVRVMPGCCLEDHTHEGSIEIHEVVEGSGVCNIDGKEIWYKSGVSAIIPKGAIHKVKAGQEGLVLVARFTPALI